MRTPLFLALALAALLSAPVTRACEVAGDVRAALDARHFDDAERLAQAAVARDPDHAQPRLQLAHVYVEWSRSDQAVAVLDEVVQRWPSELQPRVCLLEVRQLRKETEPFFGALDDTLHRFPEPDPNMIGSLEFLLRRFLENDANGSAERMCEKLVPRKDVSVPLLSNCGLSSLRQQDLDAALQRFGRARKADPQDALVAQNLSMAQILFGDLSGATTSLTALEKLDPNDPETPFELAVVATARDPDASAPAWRHAVTRLEKLSSEPAAKPRLDFARQTVASLEKPGDFGASSLAAMARALMDSRPTLSAALAHGAARRAPRDRSFPYLLAQALETNHLERRALMTLERALELPAGESDTLDIPAGALDFEAGRLADKIGRYTDAVAHLERARRARDDFPDLDYLLGVAYEGVGDTDAAQRAYADCLTRPNDKNYTDWCKKNAARLASAPAAPAPMSDFETALAQARANEASAAGRAFTPESTAALGPRLGAAIDSCVGAVPIGADSMTRTLLLRIAADGSIAETRLSEKGREAGCFAAQLRNARAPAPPAPDWWLVYDLTIRR